MLMFRGILVASLVILVGCQTSSSDDVQLHQPNDADRIAADSARCKVWTAQADQQLALEACTRLIDRGAPKEAVLVGYNNRALIFRRNDRETEALADYNAAIRKFPDAVPLYLNRGSLLSSKGKLRSAEEDFRTAFNLAPQNLVAMNNLAWVLLQQGDYESGLDLASKTLAMQPEPQIGYDTLAHSLMGLGRHAASEAAFLKAVDHIGSTLVQKYQSALARKGYEPGRTDGVFDEATRAALSACIRDNCRLLLD